MKKVLIISLFLVLLCVQSCSFAQKPMLDDEQQVWTIPTPTEDMAVIYGEVHSSTKSSVGDMVFLSENLSFDDQELPPTISFSYQYSPRAVVDTARGYFYFENVKPGGNYVVTVLTGPGNFIFVTQDDGKMPLTISVEAGDSIDLGKLIIEMPD
ncbi:MAG: hypothetical protein GX142_03350 [Chloroflexi bacterium]|jgi:hypothetical protein|nr:hypothetical protein [Chloroflexota bacterium]